VEPFSFIYRTTGGVCRRVAKSNETSEGTELPCGDRKPQAAERTDRESGELCFGIFVPQELRERVGVDCSRDDHPVLIAQASLFAVQQC
jgi:hypothetical protein